MTERKNEIGVQVLVYRSKPSVWYESQRVVDVNAKIVHIDNDGRTGQNFIDLWNMYRLVHTLHEVTQDNVKIIKVALRQSPNDL